MKKPSTQKRARNTDIRILPAVVGVGAILFALKASGLAFSANAAPAPPAAQPAPAAAAAPATAAAQLAAPIAPQAAPAAPAAKPATPAAASAAPGAAPAAAATKAGASTTLPNSKPDPLAAIDAALPNPADKPTLAEGQKQPASTSLDPTAAATSGEVDVLTSLAERRDALEERQRELDTKANVLAAAEKRVDDKIGQLKALQTQIETLLGQRETKETTQLDSLVRIYTAMKPKDAARIFNTLNGEVRLGVAGRMKPDAMAGIMAALPSDVAQKITVELASRYKMEPSMAAAASAAAPSTPPATATAPAATSATPLAPAAPSASAAAPPAKPPGG